MHTDAIPDGMEPFCGATLVNKFWVVTASHCTLGGHTDQYRVVLGEYNRSQEGDTVVRVHKVRSMHRHPEYNSVTYNNDIAMWRLEEPADFNHFRTICLPRPGMKIRNPLAVAGWGVTSEGGVLATVLKEVAVPVVSSTLCKKALAPHSITEYMLCAGGNEGQDACQGDSGGPLMGEEPGKDQVFLAGVVSWGLGCAHKGLYGVYTKVSKYQDWIENHIKS